MATGENAGGASSERSAEDVGPEPMKPLETIWQKNLTASMSPLSILLPLANPLDPSMPC